jgi:tRNA (cmo5U34)-methyltransferase
MGSGQIGSWQSAEYVGQWAGDDVMGRLLETPRRISTALLRDDSAEVGHVVDLGSGEGPYLAHVLLEYPEARGTWLDPSEPMLARARDALAEFGDRISFVVASAEELASSGIDAADVVVSSRALHHLTPASLGRCYHEVRALLRTGGWFFNLDHVGSAGDWEPRYRRIRDEFTGTRRQRLERHREDEPLHDAREHVRWLEEAGFTAVDVPWRTLYTALLAARA